MDCQRGSLLGSKDSGFYVFGTLLANHDQNNVFRNVLVLLKVVHLWKIGIELNAEKINAFRLGSID